MRLQEPGEMYLESIYVLTKNNPHVRAIDVGEYMGYSKPSVSRAVGLLKSGNYITIDDDGHITLTEAGLKTAEKIMRRHELLTELLVSLGVDRTVAAADACKMEHVISDETYEAIHNHMQNMDQ